jgi:hypothetical protein
MERTKRAILLVSMALVIPAIACLSPGLRPPNTPTPTGTVIVAQENLTPGLAATEGPVDPKASCLKTAAGAVNVGRPCLVGTYAGHYDILQKPNDHDTIVTDSLLQADVSLWAVSVGKLEGRAHLTYSLNSKQEDPQSNVCQTVTTLVTPFGWDVNLKGQYSMQPDGSVGFIVQASPPRGPDYLEVFPDCAAVPTRTESGVNWSGLGGTLVQGVMHSVTDNPVPSDSTGRFYVEVEVEAVK